MNEYRIDYRYIDRADWADATLVDNAVNLAGVVRSLARITEKLIREIRDQPLGTVWVNNHPICHCFASRIAALSGVQPYDPNWLENYEFCLEMANSQPEILRSPISAQ